jgi:hypothetical protein
LFCHVYGRGEGQAQMIPGWPYSVIAALEHGRTSWTAVLDAVRLGPGDDEAEITAAQVRDVVTRLIEAGRWREGDPRILVIFDAGYDVPRLAFLLADLPVEVLGRLRSDRVMRLPAPPRRPGAVGRPRRHGRELALADPATWPAPQTVTTTLTSRYGMAAAAAWDRVHPRLTHRCAWLDHDGGLPVIDGTLIRLQAGHLPGDRDPKPVWLWSSATGARAEEVDRLWQAFVPGPAPGKPSACSSRSSAGPPQKSATLRLLTGGPGSSSRSTPSSASPGRSPATCACPGNGPPRRGGSPRPASAAGFGTSARPSAARPVRQNPASPAPAGPQGRRTAAPHRATTWAKPPKENARSQHDTNAQVKRQAECLFLNLSLRGR